MRLDPSRPEALARLLLVAQRLHAADASEAALDLLSRGLESNGPVVDVYRALIPVFARLERFEEALEATEILRTLTNIDGAKLAA
jgi:hypothetical protein